MRTLTDIEQTIANLPPEGLAEFRAWFESFDSEQWDKQIKEDVDAGKLDRLAADAIADFEKGHCKEL